jgi:hypothetical protein
MKKVLVITVLVGLLSSSMAFAAAGRESLVTIAPISLLYGGLYANYEMSISGNKSITPRLGYYKLSISDWDISFTNLGVTYNFLGKEGLKGFVWGPRADFYMMNFKFTSVTATATAIGIGAQAIYRWIGDGGFVFEVGAVAEVVTGGSTTIAGTTSPTVSAMGFSPILNIGYAF